MATESETVASHQPSSTADEKIEKAVDDIKSTEQVNVLAEGMGESEKSKGEEPHIALSKSEKEEESVQSEPPKDEEVKKTDIVPVLDIPVVDHVKVEKETVLDPDSHIPTVSVDDTVKILAEEIPSSPVPDSVVKEVSEPQAVGSVSVSESESASVEKGVVDEADSVKSQAEEQPAGVDPVVKEAPKELSIASDEKGGQEEKPEAVDVPNLLIETTTEPEEKPEVGLINEEPEQPAAAATEKEEQDSEPKTEQQPEPAIEPVIKEEGKQTAVAIIKEESDVQPKIADSSEIRVESIEKTEEQTPEVLPVKESESVVVDQELVKDSHLGSVEAEKPDPEATQVEVESKSSYVEDEIVQDKEMLVVGDGNSDTLPVEDTQISKDEKQNNITESSEQDSSISVAAAPVDIKAGRGDPEKIPSEQEKKETSSTDVGERLPEETVTTAKEILEDKKEEDSVKAKEPKEESNGVVIIEESTPVTEGTNEDNGLSSVKTAKNSIDGEKNTEEEDEGIDKKEVDIKDEKPASVESNKADELNSTTASEPAQVGEKAAESEVKDVETVKTEVEEKVVQNLEEAIKEKEGDEVKTSEKLEKEVIVVKSIQKQSNNILSKVKQTLVKAKKAITGKSPSSKNASSLDTKGDDIKVK